jgi:hypothetical protein
MNNPAPAEALFQRLPFPIAFPVSLSRSLPARRSPESRFLHLIAALESTVRFLSLVGISDYLQQGGFEPTLNTLIRERVGRPLSLGVWLELFRETVRAFVSHKKPLRVAELTPLLSRRAGTFLPKRLAGNPRC